MTAKPSPASASSRRHPRGWIIPALVVFAVSVGVYANTIGHAFVWDDLNLIVENPNVARLDAETVARLFTEDTWRVLGREGAYYRPLTALSYHIDHALFGARPAGYHAMNVLWHAVTSVLAFALLALIAGNRRLALLGGLLFAVHPMHTESVAWVAGRTDILAALWSLVALVAYVLGRRRLDARLVAASAVAFALALLAKESAAAVLLIVLFAEVWPGDVLHIGRPRALRPAGLLVVVLVVYLALRHAVIGTAVSAGASPPAGALGRPGLALAIFAGYVKKALLPYDMNAEYDAPIPSSVTDPYVVTGFLTAAAMAWAVWRFRSRGVIVAGIAFFVLGLAPVLQIVPFPEISAERFLYFPILGVTTVIAALVSGRGGRGRRWSRVDARTVAGAVLIVACAVLTVMRNADWKNPDVLFAKTAADAPESPRAHANVGEAARTRGDFAGAETAYRRSLALNPNFTASLNGLAEVYAAQKRFDEALPLIERAIAVEPDNATFANNLGSIYFETGQFDRARQQFERALVLDPGYSRARFNLGLLALQTGDLDGARGHFRAVADVGGEFILANYHLAVIEEALGNPSQAKAYARRFLAGYQVDDGLRARAQAIATR